MSFQAMAWAVRQDTGSTIGKCILLMLANYADSEGHCFPSYDRIAKDCECSRRSVICWIERLEEKGLLTKEVRRRKDGTQTSNYITLQQGAADALGGGDQSAGGSLQGAARSRQSAAPAPEPITYPITQPITTRQVFENGKVKVHRDEPVFSAIVRSDGKSPFTNKEGFAYIDANRVTLAELFLDR